MAAPGGPRAQGGCPSPHFAPPPPPAGPCEPPRCEPGAPSPAGRRAGDLLLPLDVTLEELYSGAERQVSLSKPQLRRARYEVAEEVFEVQVEQGAPDGHRVTFQRKATSLEPGRDPGDLSFVLQERPHPRFRRRGADLYTERTITLLEALAGFRLDVRQLDGRRLVVRSPPGKVVRPRNLLPGAEAAWERFDDADAFPGQDAGCLKTGDLEACKELCRQRGFGGFAYWEDSAYFRAHGRGELLQARRQAPGCSLFVCPDPARSASLRLQHAVSGKGMPCFRGGGARGNLFILLRVELPSTLTDEAAALLREVLPGQAPAPLPPSGEGEGLEELELCDMDPGESQRRHHVATGGFSPATAAAPGDEAPPAGSPGPPPPCPTM